MNSDFKRSIWGYNVDEVNSVISSLEQKIQELTLKSQADQSEIGRLRFTVDDLTAVIKVQKEILNIKK